MLRPTASRSLGPPPHGDIGQLHTRSARPMTQAGGLSAELPTSTDCRLPESQRLCPRALPGKETPKLFPQERKERHFMLWLHLRTFSSCPSKNRAENLSNHFKMTPWPHFLRASISLQALPNPPRPVLLGDDHLPRPGNVRGLNVAGRGGGGRASARAAQLRDSYKVTPTPQGSMPRRSRPRQARKGRRSPAAQTVETPRSLWFIHKTEPHAA